MEEGEEGRALPRTVESFHQLQYEAQEQHRAAERRLPGFSGRRAEVAALAGFLDRIGGPCVLLVRGPRGSGKTTLVAEMLRQRRMGQADQGRVPSPSQQPQPPEYVSWHSFTDTIYPADLARGLERICIDLKVRFELSLELPENLADIAPAFHTFLEHACLAARVVVVMDGIDLAQTAKLGHSWLPVSLPLGAKIIMTSAHCPWLRGLKERNTVAEVDLPDLTLEESRAILNKALCCYPGGEFGGLDASVLLEMGGSRLPLYIHAASGLARIIQDEAKNVGYVQEQLAKFPSTLEEIYEAQLDRLEAVHGEVIVREVCGLLASTKFGLSEDNLVGLLKQNADMGAQETALTKLLKILDESMWAATSAPGSPTDDAVRFCSAGLRRAVAERYLPARAQRVKIHKRLAAFLEKLQPQARTLQERMYQYTFSEDWNALHQCLCSPKLWLYCFDNIDMYTLAELHTSLTSSGKCPSSVFTADYRGKCGELRGAASEKLLDYFHAMASFLFWQGKHGDVVALLEEYLASITEEEEHVYAPDPKYMDLVSFLGDTYFTKKMYQQAHEVFTKGRATCVRIYGEFSIPVAALSSRIAACLKGLGRAEESCDLYKSGTALWAASEQRNLVTESSWKYASSFTDLAEAQEELGRCSEAEKSHEGGLDRLEAMLGPDHPAVVEQLVTMGQAYKDHGEWQKSEFCYSRALTFFHQFYGSDSVPLAQTYVSLAELHCAKGAQAAANEFYGRALKVTVSLYGREHAEVAIILNNIAETYRTQRLFTEAEPLYLQSLAIDRKVSGAESSAVAIRLNNLAELYRDQKQFRKAEAFYRKSLKIGEAALGRSHPNLATYLNNLAGVCKEQRKWSEAKELYLRAKEIDARALGESHPDISIYLNNIACLYKAQGRLEDAEPVYLEALTIIQEALGDDHSDVAVYSNNLGLLYKLMGRLEDAEGLYTRAIEITRVSLSKDVQLAKRLTNLGTLKYQMKKLDEAMDLYVEALGICEESFGEDHPDTLACGAWLDTITAELQEAKGAAQPRERTDAARSADNDKRDQRDKIPLKKAERPAAPAEVPALEASPEPTLPAPASPDEDISTKEPLDEDTILSLSVEKLFSSALDEARGVDLPDTEQQDLVERPTPTFEQMESRPRGFVAEPAVEKKGAVEEPESEPAEEGPEMPSTEPLGKASPDLPLKGEIDRGASPEARQEVPAADAADSPYREEEPTCAPEAQPEEAEPTLPERPTEGGGEGASTAQRELPASKEPESPPQTNAETRTPVSETDALIMKNIEFVGSRQYRCLECGKLMSTFNLIRMHFLKSHLDSPAQNPASPALPPPSHRSSASPLSVASERDEALRPNEPAPRLPANELEKPPLAEEVSEPPQTWGGDSALAAPHKAASGARGGDVAGSGGVAAASPDKETSPEKPSTPREAALKRVQELEERLAQMQSQLNNQNASMMASSALQLLEAGMRRQMQMQAGYASGEPSPQPQNIQDITNIFHRERGGGHPLEGVPALAPEAARLGQPSPPKAESSPHGGASANGSSTLSYRQARSSPAEANPLFGVRATPGALDQGGKSPYGAEDFDSMMRHERGLLRPALNTPFSASQISIRVDSPATPLERAFGEPSPAQKAQKQVETLLGGQSGDVDFLGLFMTARSQQLGKRRFVCELDGQEFTTLNIMRVHFERRYAGEAERWWRQQAGMA